MNPVRSSLIVLEAPRYHRDECPAGLCHWCGYPLVFVESATWHNRQRVRHKGDDMELPPKGPDQTIRAKQDCDRAFKQSMVWTGQNAVRWQAWKTTKILRQTGNRYEVWCVDCNELCETGFVWVPKKRVGFATRRRTTHKKWEADHEVEIVDGGVHALENLRPRCCECHTKKTTRERRRRLAADTGSHVQVTDGRRMIGVDG